MTKRGKLISLMLCLLLACAAAPGTRGAQEPQPRPQPFVDELCPVIIIECPEAGAPGSRITFRAKVMGVGPKVSPSFRWEVSAGRIESGQDTTALVVDTTGLADASVVTATLKVGGLDRSCADENACWTALVRPPAVEKFDFYGDISFDREQARLDNFAITAQELPELNLYIVCYGGRRTYRGESRGRCERAKRYLAGRRQIAPERIVLVDGGFMEELQVWLWLLPPGTKFTPTPTVAPEEVEFISKPPVKRGGRRRAH